MRLKRTIWSLSLSLSLGGLPVLAADPPAPADGLFHRKAADCQTPPPACVTPLPGQPALAPGQVAPAPGQVAPGQPAPAPGTLTPQTDAFARAPEAGTGAAGSFNPNMFGDQGPSPVCDPLVAIIRNGQRIPFPIGAVTRVQPGDLAVLASGLTGPLGTPGEIIEHIRNPHCEGLFPNALGAGVKIADNESPRPQDRVFGTYNYYDNTFKSGVNLHREMVGFEKTLLDGNASIGMRLPFFQTGGNGPEDSDIGDLTVILKYAILNDRECGDVLSGGLAITAPTGPGFALFGNEGDLHSTLLQPWVGGIKNMGDLYVHGFSSIVIPTDDRDVVYLFNDIGVGYFLYRATDCDRLITAIVPTFETHISTPLNHRGSDHDPIPGIDIVDLTFGTTLGIGQRSTLALGVVTPVTGPKPFDVEALVQFNYRF